MAAERTWEREERRANPAAHGTIREEAPLHPGTIVPDDGGEPVARTPASSGRGRAPGVRVGPFELVRRLGEGASGEVWEAVDRRVDAPVALKLFNAHGMDPMGRVMGEARAASRVVSDHVVYVREAGRVDGEAFIAMALCREETASDAAPRVARNLLEDPPRSPAEAARWGEQIARGVAAAHAVGVYHRDLKPENALCLPRSRAVRLVDFGLAPLTPASTSTDAADPANGPLMVAPGESARYIAGSPAYMAPEQARGFRRAPQANRDDAALAALDVYGVGATLWALLAGRPPHVDPADDDGPEAVRQRAARAEPPALRTLNPNVPRRLAAIVDRAMASDPADRYPSAAALAVDLARYRADLPTSLDAPRSPVRPALYLRRHPALVAAAAWVVVVLLGLGALGAVHTQLTAATRALAAVEAQRVAAEQGATVVAALAEAEGRRADAASDAAETSSARAETAEDRAANLRRYAIQEAARAQDADIARLGAEAVATHQAELAAAAQEEAARKAADAQVADTEASAARQRANDADARAANHADAEASAQARAEAAARAAEAAVARADAATARAAEADARADAAERGTATANEAARAALGRARAAEARAAAAEARAEAAEARLDVASVEVVAGR
jgi:serine/threonine-protein kinase